MLAREYADPNGRVPAVAQGLYAIYPRHSDDEIAREMLNQLLSTGWLGAVSSNKRRLVSSIYRTF